MLKVAIGKAPNYEDSIIAALQQYNEVAGRKTFHQKSSRYDRVVRDANLPLEVIWITEIWFTLQVPAQQEPVYKYIGSEGIDPNDPNWREKRETYNASETSQEDRTATIDSTWYSGIGSAESEP